jgi:hypothetical protein
MERTRLVPFRLQLSFGKTWQNPPWPAMNVILDQGAGNTYTEVIQSQRRVREGRGLQPVRAPGGYAHFPELSYNFLDIQVGVI